MNLRRHQLIIKATDLAEFFQPIRYGLYHILSSASEDEYNVFHRQSREMRYLAERLKDSVGTSSWAPELETTCGCSTGNT